MFFFVSKAVAFAISPLNWIIALFIMALLTRNQVKKKKRFLAAGIMLLILTNPFIVNTVFRQWETPSRRINDIARSYDAGILLGGAMRYYNAETNRMVYGHSVDRLIQAVTLYREGKIRKIVVSGGSGFVFDRYLKESELLRDVMLQLAVPDSDIVLEKASRNTHENAAYTASLLREKFPGGSFVLITSAYHMPRSMACFAKEGIVADAFAVDEHSRKAGLTPNRLFLPDPASLQAWHILFHEWAGCLAYKMAGYL